MTYTIDNHDPQNPSLEKNWNPIEKLWILICFTPSLGEILIYVPHVHNNSNYAQDSYDNTGSIFSFSGFVQNC